jgi:hypothetical protein
MDQSQSGSVSRETQAQIDACLAVTGTTMDQVRRWRREGLLPDAIQKPNPYSGSSVYYLPGTSAQIVAIARLIRVKHSLSYVGQQLWWEGFSVPDRYWQPRLLKAAQRYDSGIRRIAEYVARDVGGFEQPTLQERIAKSRVTNIIMSRIRGRLSREGLAAHIGIVLSVATGEFQQFNLPGSVETEAFDQARTIEAMDLEASRTDAIFGNSFAFIRELPIILRVMSSAQETCPFEELAQGPALPILEARDDVRNGLRMAVAMYEANRWIYGPQAFGLRLAAWIGKKQPEWLMPLLILGFARLRRSSIGYLSSAEIKSLAETAEKAKLDSLKIKALWQRDPRFKLVFNPKNIRRAFQDIASYNNWLKEVQRAADYA